MKILFCCPCPPVRELGIGKHLLELAEALQEKGCECNIISPDDVRAENPALAGGYNTALRAYLRRHAGKYDVVDYEHVNLPFPRSDFAPLPLFVARSFLLRHHLATIAIPGRRLWRSHLRRFFYGWWLDRHRRRGYLRDAQKAVEEADLVNVLNDDDQRALVAAGISPGKIVTIGLGLTADHLTRLHALAADVPTQPTVVSVATFDTRKGAVELPAILEQIWRRVPGVRFRLLGGRRPLAAILARFPASLHPVLEIIPEYRQEELPALLADASVGIFPSYMEGFPLGVLEMGAAAIPVVAYDAPGAPMILPPEWLVQRGDHRALATKATDLLTQKNTLAKARQTARNRSAKFTMEAVAHQTRSVYAELVRARRAANSVAPTRLASSIHP